MESIKSQELTRIKIGIEAFTNQENNRFSTLKSFNIFLGKNQQTRNLILEIK